MNMSEHVQPSPEIVWAKITWGESTVKPSSETYGLVSISVGHTEDRINQLGIRLPTIVRPSYMDHTTLRFGSPDYETVKAVTVSGVMLAIDDAEIINEIGILAKDTLNDIDSIVSAREIKRVVNDWKRRKVSRGRVDSSSIITRAVGVLEEVLIDAEGKKLPVDLHTRALRLQELGVDYISSNGFSREIIANLVHEFTVQSGSDRNS